MKDSQYLCSSWVRTQKRFIVYMEVLNTFKNLWIMNPATYWLGCRAPNPVVFKCIIVAAALHLVQSLYYDQDQKEVQKKTVIWQSFTQNIHAILLIKKLKIIYKTPLRLGTQIIQCQNTISAILKTSFW